MPSGTDKTGCCEAVVAVSERAASATTSMYLTVGRQRVDELELRTPHVRSVDGSMWDHRLMGELIIRDMTRNEFDRWRDGAIRSFADEQVAAGIWSSDEAIELGNNANDALLPDGFATAGMRFLRAELPDGTYVGVLWVGLTHPRGASDCAFIYDIEIDEAHRGAGYGRALLAAAEDAVRAHGVGAVELNVFGDNTRAIRLYETSGYRIVTQQMRKSLR